MLQISFPFCSNRFFIIFYVVICGYPIYHAQHCPTGVKLKTLSEIGGRVRFGAGLRSCFWLPQWQHAEGPNGLGSCHPLWKVFLKPLALERWIHGNCMKLWIKVSEDLEGQIKVYGPCQMVRGCPMGSWHKTHDISRLFTQTVGTTLDRKRRPSAKPSWRSWSAPKVGADSRLISWKCTGFTWTIFQSLWIDHSRLITNILVFVKFLRWNEHVDVCGHVKFWPDWCWFSKLNCAQSDSQYVAGMSTTPGTASMKLWCRML